MKNFPYEAFYRFSSLLLRNKQEVTKTVQIILSQSSQLLDVKKGCFVTFNEDNSIQNAYVLSGDDGSHDDVTPWEKLMERGLIGFVYHALRTVVVPSVETDPRWPTDDNIIAQKGSAIGLPIVSEKRAFGVLLFVHDETDFFDPDKVKIAEEIARLAGDAVSIALGINGKADVVAPYHAVFHDAVIPIILTDLDGTIVDINRQAIKMLGYKREQLIGNPMFVVNDMNRDAVDALEHCKVNMDEPRSFRTVTHLSMGTDIPSIVRIRRVKVDRKDVVEWVQQDISAQMELEQLRRDLSAMVYHDLRGPLQTIRTSIHKLAQSLARHENPAVLTFLQMGIRSVRQLRRMVDGLLDIQRLEAGQNILDRDEIELRVVLTDAVQLVQPLAFENGHKLVFDWENDLPMVEVDNDMIVRVIINLMENAIKYTPDNGTITISAARNGADRVIVRIKDSGPGIPKQMLSQVFDKYSRVKYQDVPKGVGLGLAFCRLAINAHGGDIWVESEEGDGSTFVFTLPLNTVPVA